MINNLKKLSQKLDLDLTEIMDDRLLDFPLQAPVNFIARIKKNDINDPLLLQILPQQDELKKAAGFSLDPLAEKSHSPVTGLIHKYYGRVLLLITDNCAVNCRFCFRRHQRSKITDWQKVDAYIQHDPTINEVILSGGDPLTMNHHELKKILDRLASVPHIKKIRIHSRVPIVMPELVKPKLFQAKIPLVLMIHCNHPQEISAEVSRKLNLLKKRQVTIFNQAVLLRGVNDDSGILIALSEKLFAAGVLPCYLHLLDKVQGAAHFYVGLKKAKQIYLKMRSELPGYLMPKLVREVRNKKQYV